MHIIQETFKTSSELLAAVKSIIAFSELTEEIDERKNLQFTVQNLRVLGTTTNYFQVNYSYFKFYDFKTNQHGVYEDYFRIFEYESLIKLAKYMNNVISEVNNFEFEEFNA